MYTEGCIHLCVWYHVKIAFFIKIDHLVCQIEFRNPLKKQFNLLIFFLENVQIVDLSKVILMKTGKISYPQSNIMFVEKREQNQ